MPSLHDRWHILAATLRAPIRATTFPHPPPVAARRCSGRDGWHDSPTERFGRFIAPCLGVESPRLICSIGPASRRRPRRTDSNRSWSIALARPNFRTDTIAATITTEGFTLPNFPIGIGPISRRTFVARNAARSDGSIRGSIGPKSSTSIRGVCS